MTELILKMGWVGHTYACNAKNEEEQKKKKRKRKQVWVFNYGFWVQQQLMHESESSVLKPKTSHESWENGQSLIQVRVGEQQELQFWVEMWTETWSWRSKADLLKMNYL